MYRIARAYTIEDLEKKIDSFFMEGYICQGGIFVMECEKNDGQFHDFHFYQAMVKEE